MVANGTLRAFNISTTCPEKPHSGAEGDPFMKSTVGCWSKIATIIFLVAASSMGGGETELVSDLLLLEGEAAAQVPGPLLGAWKEETFFVGP